MTIFIDIPPVKIDVLELLRRIDKSDQKTLLRAILGGEGKLRADEALEIAREQAEVL